MPTIRVTLTYDEAEMILRGLSYGGRLRPSNYTDLQVKIESALVAKGDFASWEIRRSADLTADWRALLDKGGAEDIASAP